MKYGATMKPLALYASACERSAAQIIQSYSTSFGIATRLLGARHRHHIQNIYALVRIADELVDGVAAEAGLTPALQATALNQLESDTDFAIRHGYSSNPMVHAFAATARCSGIESDLIQSFFASMRMDLEAGQVSDDATEGVPRELICFEQSEHATYVYGSAEAVGLMCLRVFMREESVSEEEALILERGARSLGAAFQNVNFLRDLADDTYRLGRSYLSQESTLSREMKQHWVDTIRDQLAVARESLPLLPADARLGVMCALRLFASLADRLAQAPVQSLYASRIRVPASQKLWIVAQSLVQSRRVAGT